MARIKITGYLDTEDLEANELDMEHPMGLSAEGYETLVMGMNTPALSLSALDDVDVELVK